MSYIFLVISSIYCKQQQECQQYLKPLMPFLLNNCSESLNALFLSVDNDISSGPGDILIFQDAKPMNTLSFTIHVVSLNHLIAALPLSPSYCEDIKRFTKSYQCLPCPLCCWSIICSILSFVMFLLLYTYKYCQMFCYFIADIYSYPPLLS